MYVDEDEDPLVIELYAYQFDWRARYSGKDNTLGKANVRLIEGINQLGVDTSDPNAQDTFIDHTNADEIRTANGVTVTNETMTQTPDQAFEESVEDEKEEVVDVVDDNKEVEVEDLEKEFAL